MNTFNPNIPQPGDDQDVSQGDLLNNNTSLQYVYGINHWPLFPSTENDGYHSFVTLPSFPNTIGSLPPAPTDAITNALTIFTQIVGGRPQLYGIATDTTIFPVSPISTVANPGSLILGSILINFGSVNFVVPGRGSASADVTYQTPYSSTPSPVAPIVLLPGLGTNPGGASTIFMNPKSGSVNSQATITITAPNTGGGTFTAYWMTIGAAP